MRERHVNVIIVLIKGVIAYIKGVRKVERFRFSF